LMWYFSQSRYYRYAS